jgi:hypothetical protein
MLLDRMWCNRWIQLRRNVTKQRRWELRLDECEINQKTIFMSKF